MTDNYIANDGEPVVAMQVSPELVTVISVWCHGLVVEEIDPIDNQKFPALNLETREGVSRASLGDYVLKHQDGTFEVRKPGAFKRDHIPKT